MTWKWFLIRSSEARYDCKLHLRNYKATCPYIKLFIDDDELYAENDALFLCREHRNYCAAMDCSHIGELPFKAILQLHSHWFLVFSPSMFTAYILGQNGYSSQAHIGKAINQILIDPSCFLDLMTITSPLMSDNRFTLQSNTLNWSPKIVCLFSTFKKKKLMKA